MKEQNPVIVKLTQIQFLASPKIFFVDQGLFYQYILILKTAVSRCSKNLNEVEADLFK